MKAQIILSAAAVLVAGNSSDALGQNAPRPSRPDSSCTHYQDGRVECVRVFSRTLGDSSFRRMMYRTDSTLMKRAALGLELRATGTRRDTLGVFVAAVTRGGPAETAGIVEGDRIATINGVDVRSAAGDIDDPYTNGLGSHRLTKEIQKIAPGTRVTLRVYSGGRFRDVAVTAGRASEVFRQAGRFIFSMPNAGRRIELRSPDGAMMIPDIPLDFDEDLITLLPKG